VSQRVVSWRHLENLAENGARGERAPEGENLVQRRGVNLSPHAARRQQGLDLRPENQRSVSHSVIQRADAQPVAGQEQFTPAFIPDGDGELSVEMPETVGAKVLVEVNDNLGIRRGAEAMSPRLQLWPELDVVENLAVEDDPQRLILVGYGLRAGGEVNDAQPRVP